ncbi:hypothetical protein ALT721_1360051 [Alteromonas alvinellae]
MSTIKMTDELINDALDPDSSSFFVIERGTDFQYLIKLHKEFGPLNQTIFADTDNYDVFIMNGETKWFEEQIMPWLDEESSGPIEKIELGPQHSFYHRKLPRILVQHEPSLANDLKTMRTEEGT